VQFADPAGTWAHIDPQTGQLPGSIDLLGLVTSIAGAQTG